MCYFRSFATRMREVYIKSIVGGIVEVKVEYGEILVLDSELPWGDWVLCSDQNCKNGVVNIKNVWGCNLKQEVFPKHCSCNFGKHLFCSLVLSISCINYDLNICAKNITWNMQRFWTFNSAIGARNNCLKICKQLKFFLQIA